MQGKGVPGKLVEGENMLDHRRHAQTMWLDHDVIHSILDALSDMIGVFRPNGELLFVKCNHPLLAVPVQTGEWIESIDSPFRLEAIKSFLNVTKTLQPQIIQYRYQNRFAKWLWVEATGIPVLNGTGQLDYVVVTVKDVSTRKESEEQLIHMAYYDPLTGLPNRRLLMEQLQRSVAYARRHGRMLGLLYLDVDDFKLINDTLGHEMGDEFLKMFAEKVKACIREEDMLARLGGDEFVILLPLIDSADSVHVVQNRIHRSISSPWEMNGHVFFPAVSCGTAVYPLHADEPAGLLRHADRELYQMKST